MLQQSRSPTHTRRVRRYYLPMEMLHRGVPFIDYAATQGLDADAAAELYIRGYNVEATGMLQSNVLTTQVISTVGMAAAFGLGIHSVRARKSDRARKRGHRANPPPRRMFSSQVHTRGDWASLNVNRLIHNRDQLEYLVESGRLRAPVFRELLANYTAVYEHEEATREAVGRNRTTSFVPTAAQVVYIGTSLGRFLYRPPDPPLRELPPELLHPLNPANDWAAIEQEVGARRAASVSCGSRSHAILNLMFLLLTWFHALLCTVPEWPSWYCGCGQCAHATGIVESEGVGNSKHSNGLHPHSYPPRAVALHAATESLTP